MSDLIKKIKIKKQDDTYTDYIPIGAEAKNVDCSDGESVEYKLNKKPYYYNSVADMKADTSLKVGDMVITLGYYEPNDGGGAEYRIVKTSDKYVEDLENSLKAELIIKDEMSPEMFGAYADGTHNDTTAIQLCINNCKIIKFIGNYKISNTIYLKSNIKLLGMAGTSISKIIGVHFPSFYSNPESLIENVYIENLQLIGEKYWTGQSLSGFANDFGIRIKNGKNIIVNNCSFVDFGGCAISVTGTNLKIIGNNVLYTGTFLGDIPNYNFGISYEGQYVTIDKNTVKGVIQGIISGLTNKNITISNNDISTNGQHGLYMEGGYKVIIVNNNIHDCSLCGVKFQINNIEMENELFENIIINSNNIINCGAQGILLTDIKHYATMKNFSIIGNNIKKCERGINLNYISNCNMSSNNLEDNTMYNIYVYDSNNIIISSNKFAASDNSNIYFANTGSRDYENIFIEGNEFITNNITGTSGSVLRINSGNNIIVKDNFAQATGNTDIIDGFLFGNTETSLTNTYILNNIIKGYRWDIRVLKPNGITIKGNYYNTITGISQDD